MPGIDGDGLSTFLQLRARLFGIAYRILGSSAAAEDVVQDVWIRWQRTDRITVRDAGAFLATATTRLAINVLQSARFRHETCGGPCVPEPADIDGDQTVRAEREDELAHALFMLLERLPPAERAAYVLREAFDYSYRDIAQLLSLQEANTRQLVSRARQHLAQEPRMLPHPTDHRRVVAAFQAACRSGDAAALVGALTC